VTTGRKLALGATAIGGVVVLALAGLHFYLKLGASRYRAELVRRGERLRIEQVRPKFVSPNDNGAPMLQVAAGQLPRQTGTKGSPLYWEMDAMVLLPSGRAIVGWRQPDLRHARATETNSWVELREELDSLASTLDQVRSELRKPGFDFQLDYSQGAILRLPHLNGLNSARQALLSATLLHLHEGNMAAALEDLQSQLALVRVLENEPILISQLVRARQMTSVLRSTWEALQSDSWNDAQLSKLQTAWQALYFFDSFRRALLMTRAMMLYDISELRESNSRYQAVFTFFGRGASGTPISNPLAGIVESGKRASFELERATWGTFWSHYDERRYLVLMQDGIESSRRPTDVRVRSIELRNIRTAMVRLGFRETFVDPANGTSSDSGNFSARRLVKEGAGELEISLGAFKAETERELVLASIALKRYQLRSGKTAGTLADLVPEFLPQIPRDYMDGQPLKFSPNGTYLLYSVGLDGKDDNPEWGAGRDWVWPQPANGEAVEAHNTQTGVEIAKEFNREQKKAIRKPART
jgi:hypothetical protein